MGQIKFLRSCPSLERECDRLIVLLVMSIVQGRLVGLAHFTADYVLTYAAFLIAATIGKSG